MTRGVEHLKASDLVALSQLSGDGVRSRGGHQRPIRGDHLSLLDRHHIVGPTPEWDAELLADRVARAVVIEMGVRERVRGDRAAGDLAQDPSLVESEPSVNQNVAQY